PSSPRFPSTTLFRSKIAGRIARRGDTPFRRTFDYGVCCTCIARQRSSSTWPAAGDRSGGGRGDPARMVGRTECGVEVGRGRVVRGRCMTDRWARAEEAFRQREAAERRYRRDDAAWERAAGHAEPEESWDDRDDYDEPAGRMPARGYADDVDGYGSGYAAAYQDEGYADGYPADGEHAAGGHPANDEDDYDTAVIPRYREDDPAYAQVARSRAARGGRGAAAARAAADLDEDEADAPARPASRSEAGSRSRPAGRATGADRRAPSGRPAKSAKAAAGPARGKQTERTLRAQQARRRTDARDDDGGRRRHTRWVLIALAVLLLGGVGAYGVMKMTGGYTPPEDFAGPPGPLVVVRVEPGDTATQISQEMYDKGVVASSAAFYEAAVQNEGMNSVQPGYYQIPSNSPAVDAVSALLAPQARVGNMVISEGRQLHDQTDVNTGAIKEGIYTKIAAASCVGEGAEARCVTYEELDAAGASDDLAALGVPAWAEAEVRAAPDQRRQLEGLIAAGTWDF